MPQPSGSVVTTHAGVQRGSAPDDSGRGGGTAQGEGGSVSCVGAPTLWPLSEALPAVTTRTRRGAAARDAAPGGDRGTAAGRAHFWAAVLKQRPPRVVGCDARMMATSRARAAAVACGRVRTAPEMTWQCELERASPADAMGKDHKKRKHSHKHDTCVPPLRSELSVQRLTNGCATQVEGQEAAAPQLRRRL